MKQHWTVEEQVEHFTLRANERAWIGENDPHNQLGKAVLLKYFQQEGRFPQGLNQIPQALIGYMAQQLYVSEEALKRYDWNGRRIREHRQAIRVYLGFRRANRQDQAQIKEWLSKSVLPQRYRASDLESAVYEQLRDQHLEPPSEAQVTRLVTSAIHHYHGQFCQRTYQQLAAPVRSSLKQLLEPVGITLTEEAEEAIGDGGLHDLKLATGGSSVAAIKIATQRLQRLQAIGLPSNLFEDIPFDFLRHYQQQVAVESPSHLRRREGLDPAHLYTLLAVFCWVRHREITDAIIDSLLRVLKDMQTRAEHGEKRQVVSDLGRIHGKQQLLFRLAEAMLANPSGVIESVLYPIVGQEQLEALVAESKQTRPLQQAVQERISASYGHHYRQILPRVLEVLTFRSNNEHHRPLLQAIALVIRYLNDKHPFYPLDEVVPLGDVIPKAWREWIYQTDRQGTTRIRRTRYELCVLQRLREQLRSKEIWVEGADRYRNPETDLPVDFAAHRERYYQALSLPQSADQFITQLQSQLHQALQHFHDGLASNAHVKLLASGHIQVKRLNKQTEPITLIYLKQHIQHHWGMVSLIDVLKEVDLRVGFSETLYASDGQSRLSPLERQKRILLCLYGLGTNTGLSRVSMGQVGIEDSHLHYVRRRYLTSSGLRAAIAQVVNATLQVKDPHIWGEMETWSASDSKQFAAWSQNLRTQWHHRYRQAGVMVYWHVSNQSLCIYSQLKAPSSSEVASMIEGVLRHCTAMQLDRNYVDTHGQSEVAFAFCHLLGFQLMPRLKNIYAQRVHFPDADAVQRYPGLAPIFHSVIDWAVIRRQYDELVKYATALRLGTADTESILKRFTRTPIQHPTYKALSELGRAVKTLFLCRYLAEESVRQEIAEGLNVVENWNSANGFIFYGRQSEIHSNDIESQTVSILSMHLLQACLVYINTLMLQQVLADPTWVTRLTPADWRGLTPLFYRHINPYGQVALDLHTRIPYLDLLKA